jgi:hypothetical protein
MQPSAMVNIHTDFQLLEPLRRFSVEAVLEALRNKILVTTVIGHKTH